MRRRRVAPSAISSLGVFMALSLCSVAATAETTFYATPNFEVTDFDLQMYLRDMPANLEGSAGSRARNLQALSDLYALRLLEGDARSLQLLSEKEKRWIAEYRVAMETVKRYLELKVSDMMENTDWEAEARELYLANTEAYQVPESVSIRTFLIRTDKRSEEEAVEIARSLVASEMSETEFIAVVKEHSEDENGAKNGGLMDNVLRGSTVAPFEEAAFALREPLALSDVVVTRYGAHVIQLLEYKPAVQKTFNQAVGEILPALKEKRKAQYFVSLREEARVREPEGFMRNVPALDALMAETSDGALPTIPQPD